MSDAEVNFTYEVATTLEEARRNLKLAREQFERSPTYHYARAIQIAQRQFDNLAKEARSTFFVFDGSKGKHDITPYEVTVSALKEIVGRAKELQVQYQGIDYAPTSYIRYFMSVAEHSLSSIGETTEVQEITPIAI